VYGLLREKGALVIGLASTADQARIVYDRLLAIIKAEPLLAKRFHKATDTRGIRATNGSRYEIKASKSGAVQGLATSIGIIDELHITSPALWTDLVNGISAKPKGMVFGITTAGDEESNLLIRLYKRAEDAPERFGFFIWEAPEATIPDDDEELGQYLMLANPSIAEGRRPLADEIISARTGGGDGKEGEADIIHYRLNRFVASLNPFLPFDKWKSRVAPEGYTFPVDGPLVFTLDITPEDTYASITATRKTADGHLHSELVAWFVYPSQETLTRVMEKLWKHSPRMYAGDGYKCRPILNEMKRRGYPVHIGTAADAMNSASFLHAKVMHQEFTHAGDDLLSMQMPRATRKNKGDVYRIDRTSSSVEIDAVIATALGAYVAEQLQELPIQVF
jgi:phage terminase large subunit-like protein